MKQFVVAVCLIAAVAAAPSAPQIIYKLKGSEPISAPSVFAARMALAPPPPLQGARAIAPPAAIAIPAAPASPAKSAALARRLLPALAHEEVHDEFGQYALRYVTAEGTVVSERGRLIPTPDGKAYVMINEGEISYIGEDGKTYITKYTAGLDGYKAEGKHLPVPPEPVQ